MPDSCTLSVKAIPYAPRNEIVGWLGEALKIKIHAPAVEGRATEALCEYLAERLGVSKRSVTVMQGETSRLKVLKISGLTKTEALRRLGV